MQALFEEVPLASWIRMCSVWMAGRSLDDGEGVSALPELWQRDLGNGGHDFRRYTDALADLVRGDLVSDEPERRGQRIGPATSSWFRQLPDGMDLAA